MKCLVIVFSMFIFMTFVYTSDVETPDGTPVTNGTSTAAASTQEDIARNPISESQDTPIYHRRGYLVNKGSSGLVAYSRSGNILARHPVFVSRVTPIFHVRKIIIRDNRKKFLPDAVLRSFTYSIARKILAGNALTEPRVTKMSHSIVIITRKNHGHKGSDEKKINDEKPLTGDSESLANSSNSGQFITGNALNESQVTEMSHSRENTTRTNQDQEKSGKKKPVSSDEKTDTGNPESFTDFKSGTNITGNAPNEMRVTGMSHSGVNTTLISQDQKGSDEKEAFEISDEKPLTDVSGSISDSTSETNITGNAFNESRVTEMSHSRVNSTRINQDQKGLEEKEPIRISDEKTPTGNTSSLTNFSKSKNIIAGNALNKSQVTQMPHPIEITPRINLDHEGSEEKEPFQISDEKPLNTSSVSLTNSSKSGQIIAGNALNESQVTEISHSRVNTSRMNQDQKSSEEKEPILISDEKFLTTNTSSLTKSSNSEEMIAGNAWNVSQVTQMPHYIVIITRLNQDHNDSDEKPLIDKSESFTNTSYSGKITVGNAPNETRVTQMSHYRVNTTRMNLDHEGTDEKEPIEISNEKPLTGKSESLTNSSKSRRIVARNELIDSPGVTITQRINDVDSNEKGQTESSLEKPPTRTTVSPLTEKSASLVFEKHRNFVGKSRFIFYPFYVRSIAAIQGPSTILNGNGRRNFGNQKQYIVKTPKHGLRTAGKDYISIQNFIYVIGLPMQVA